MQAQVKMADVEITLRYVKCKIIILLIQQRFNNHNWSVGLVV